MANIIVVRQFYRQKWAGTNENGKNFGTFSIDLKNKATPELEDVWME